MKNILLVNDYKLTVAQANADIYGNFKDDKEAFHQQKLHHLETLKDELISEEDRDNNMLIIMTMLNIE